MVSWGLSQETGDSDDEEDSFTYTLTEGGGSKGKQTIVLGLQHNL